MTRAPAPCPPRRLVCALGALAATACGGGGIVLLAAGPVVRLHRHLSRGGASTIPLDAWVAGCAGVALVGCTLWLAVVTAACVHEASTGAAPPEVLRRLTPVAVRRTLLLACGVAVGTAGVTLPASAADPAPAGPPAVAHPLTGLPLPDRTVGTPVTTSAERFTARVVRPGDSLWSIAAGLLPRGASDREVNAAWRRLHALNQEQVGDDPDLLIPGTTLRLPVRHPADG